MIITYPEEEEEEEEEEDVEFRLCSIQLEARIIHSVDVPEEEEEEEEKEKEDEGCTVQFL